MDWAIEIFNFASFNLLLTNMKLNFNMFRMPVQSHTLCHVHATLTITINMHWIG